MEFISWKKEDGVAIATINRPPANALSRALILEVDALLDEVKNDPEVRAIVFHGEGRFFSALMVILAGIGGSGPCTTPKA